MKIDYKCKFCGLTVQVEVCDDVQMFTLSKWKPLLSCNRCGDHHEGTRKQIGRICKTANGLIMARQTQVGQALLKIEAKARELLFKQTKVLASNICHHHRVNCIWEEQFPEMIIEKPEKATEAIAFFRRGVKRIREEDTAKNKQLIGVKE